MALRRIALRDFVIVHHLELDLEAGFTVLTGETGAGKSILIDALQFATGARADSGVVREACTRAEVCAEFDADAKLLPWLQEAGVDSAEGVLLLRRQVDTQGRSRAWINGTPATAQQLRQLGEQLLDIHGQHAWQSLTRASSMRTLLDAYAQLDIRPLEQAWSQWRGAAEALQQAQAAQATLAQERERLQWQLGEIDKLKPGAHEWEELNTEHRRLANSQSLLEAAQSVLDGLHEGEAAHLRGLHRALAQLQGVVTLESAFQAPVELLESATAQVEEAVHALRAYLRHSEPDPARLAQLDERMALWMSLARRYHRTPDTLAATRAQWHSELQALDAAADMAQLQEQEQRAEQTYRREAQRVGKARAQAARRLQAEVTAAMQGLGMEGGRLRIEVDPHAPAGPAGTDAVEFLVAGHAGSTPRPVAKVASGGELSRIALAIAVCTSRLGNAATLVFDEVDAGIGGTVAQTVGRLLRQLGQDRQVLAVTHLPQVAACAHQHLRVSKARVGTATLSAVEPLTKPQMRHHELARMLGGDTLSDTSLAHAQAMLQEAS
ncbi:MAG: DNA repair protein RecN [Rhodoferax sp.]